MYIREWDMGGPVTLNAQKVCLPFSLFSNLDPQGDAKLVSKKIRKPFGRIFVQPKNRF
jgi:hypothetical protein